MENEIRTKGGYVYTYNSNLSCFSIIPEEDSEYSVKRKIFLTEKGFFTDEKPLLDTEYEPSYIEANLANLRQLLIEVTDDCNLRCKYCSYGEFYENYDMRTGKNQKFENVKILIDYLADFWGSYKNISFDNVIVIGFYGGEPLMNFSLIQQVIDYTDTIAIPELSFSYGMTTNGVLLNKYMDYIADKKFRLLISLDGTKENNQYRVTKYGKESFDVIYSNINCLKEKYPEYFNTYVNFNAVLHNRNSFISIYTFIKNTFNKVPRISQLNSNGVSEEKEKDFFEMFVDSEKSLNQLKNCEDVITEDVFELDRQTKLFNNFIESYSGNTYKTIPDLFFAKGNLRFVPTNTCPPFYKKIFLTVNNKLLSCEKIGQNYPLGYIENGKVHLDMNEIKDFYSNLFNDIIDKCRNCLLWKDCKICIYILKRDENNKLTCPLFFGEKEMNNYFSEHLSMLESDPELYERIIKEIVID
jgi:uncharacterized protein